MYVCDVCIILYKKRFILGNCVFTAIHSLHQGLHIHTLVTGVGL